MPVKTQRNTPPPPPAPHIITVTATCHVDTHTQINAGREPETVLTDRVSIQPYNNGCVCLRAERAGSTNGATVVVLPYAEAIQFLKDGLELVRQQQDDR